MDEGSNFNADRIDLATVRFTPELLAALPAPLALRYRVLPVWQEALLVTIAIADPSELDTIDALHCLLKKEIQVVIADKEQLETFVPKLYGTE